MIVTVDGLKHENKVAEQRKSVPFKVNPADVEIFGDMLLLRRLADNEVTPGGIIVPDMAKKNTPFILCEVLKVGDGMLLPINGKKIAPNYKVGDIAIFMNMTQGKVESSLLFDDNNQYWFISEKSIMFRISKEEWEEKYKSKFFAFGE